MISPFGRTEACTNGIISTMSGDINSLNFKSRTGILSQKVPQKSLRNYLVSIPLLSATYKQLLVRVGSWGVIKKYYTTQQCAILQSETTTIQRRKKGYTELTLTATRYRMTPVLLIPTSPKESNNACPVDRHTTSSIYHRSPSCTTISKNRKNNE